MTPDQILASVTARLGPMAEWNLADPSALVEAWRMAICQGIPRPGCNYLTTCGRLCNKCGKVHDVSALMNDPQRARADRLAAALHVLLDANTAPPKGGFAGTLIAVLDAVQHARATLAQEQA